MSRISFYAGADSKTMRWGVQHDLLFSFLMLASSFPHRFQYFCFHDDGITGVLASSQSLPMLMDQMADDDDDLILRKIASLCHVSRTRAAELWEAASGSFERAVDLHFSLSSCSSAADRSRNDADDDERTDRRRESARTSRRTTEQQKPAAAPKKQPPAAAAHAAAATLVAGTALPRRVVVPPRTARKRQ